MSNRPLVARVTVEWAKAIADDPKGTFDISITPPGNTAETPDVWVDRDPKGSFDRALDAQGRPLGNGDKPKPGARTTSIARISNSGISNARM